MHRFAAAAAAPIVLNLVLIAVLALAALLGLGNEPATGLMLVWGVCAAGVLQFIMLLIACNRAGMSFSLRRPRMTDGVRRLLRLGVPGVVAGGITQINILIGTMIATFQAGAVSYLYYADRVYQLPLGVVGIAIGVVLLPDLSRKLGRDDAAGVHDSQNRALEFSMLLTIPAAVALVAIPVPVVQVLFERGAFVAADTNATAMALAAFAFGLPSFVLIKVFSPGFFAREDTRTPMIYAGVAVVSNILASLVLFSWLGHVGIALASTVAGWINALMLAVTLARRGHYAPDDRLRRRLPRIVLSSLVMGVVVGAMSFYVADLFTRDHTLALRVVALAALVAVGAAVYFLAAEASGATSVRELARAFRRAPAK
jgi:putative peptidoglycan lipid II flippase